MQQILKRLELIKTSIVIEDEEIIELQVAKLSSMDVDDEVKKILQKIADCDYGSVVLDIENYIAKYSGVVVYEDKELQGLRLELKVLENRLQELSEQKNEYINTINEFNTKYNLVLGDLIQKILHLKQEILYLETISKNSEYQRRKDKFEKTKSEYEDLKEEFDEIVKELKDKDVLDDDYDEIYEEYKRVKEELKEKEQELNYEKEKFEELEDELEDDPAWEEYQKAKEDYEEFSEEYEEIINEDRCELNDEELAELKKIYRKASKLCHPDIVADELKEQAHEIMQQLNEAYSRKDLKIVKEILLDLESGNGFKIASDAITDKELLKSKIVVMREEIEKVSVELEEIKQDEVVEIIDEIDDWDEYLESLKVQLEDEYERLKEKRDRLNEDSYEAEELTSTSSASAKDSYTDYWNEEF